MGIFIIETKINWTEVAKQASLVHGRTVNKCYCRALYRGEHNSPKLLKIIQEIIDTAKKTELPEIQEV